MCGRGDTDTPRPTSAGGSNSSHPVRYFNGDIQLSVDDLASTAAGMSWGHHRTYSNRLSTDYDYGNGYNWVVAAWPYMLDQPGGTVVVVFDPRESYWFDLVDGLYVARHGQSQGLVYDTANSLFKLTFPDGRLFEFRDLASETSHAGRLSRVVAPSGAVTEVTAYTSAEQIAEVQRSSTSGSTLTVESYLYSYLTSGDLESVTLRRRVGSGDWENVARACYTYYASGDTHGSAADLKTAVHQLPDGSSWIDGDVYYYRYYLSGETGGLIHMLKYVVRPRAYAALAADSRVSDPLTASDAIVAEYADSYFEYNSSWRVTREVVEGGSREYLFSYTDGTHADGYSDWKRKTQETLPDGSRNVVYTNYRGQVLLKEFQPADGDSHVEFHQYDARGRLTLSADSSSIASYVDNAGTGANELAVTYRTESATRSLGLVKLYEYYATTDLEQGAVAGYPSYDKIQKGPDGTAIKLHKYEYCECKIPLEIGDSTGSSSSSSAYTGPWRTVYPVSREIRYRNEDGTAQIVTSYTYDWWPGTLQMRQRTTTLPVVSTDQNGSGTAATRVERFDEFGYLLWFQDERGFVTHYAVDPASGNVTQRIQDVDDGQLALPDGWSTPTGGGLHLVTDYEYDWLGRVTQTLRPAHEVDLGGTATTVRTAQWTVYQDADRETWSAQGYATGTSPSYTYTLVNPVSISKQTADGTRAESIQAVRASTSGRLSASDTFAQSSYVRWSVSLADSLGRPTAARVYHTIPASGDGSSDTNYNETTYAYDSMGRQNRQETPGGTITRTLHDAYGRATAVYVGTDDTCATDDDPTGAACDEGGSGSSSSSSSSANPNNMVLVTEYVYAGPSGCTGCCGGGSGQLIATIQHVDSTTTRTTELMYDWRNRREFTLSDPDDQGRYVYSRSQYDNLDQVIRVERYHDVAGDGPDPDGGTHPDDILISRGETDYDDRGQVYATRTYAVDPTTGTVGNYLEGNTWYDAAGNPIKQQSAGSQQFAKSVYDGLGRSVKQYVGFDVDETSYADATSIADDTILEQTETTYDATGSMIFVAHRRRFHNATGEGELTSPSGSQPKARVSYVAYYQDAIGRSLAAANYGTNDGTAPTRSATVPARSDDILVASTEYDNTGMAYKSIDPMGRENRQFFDALGRATKTVQNYQDGIVVESAPDEDVTIENAYNADGLLVTLTAWNLTTGNQVTRYVYGTTLSDSAVARADLLRAEIYPDSDDTADPLANWADGLYDRVEYCYNRQGERIERKDQNETVHAYEFDRLGRLVHDRVTAVGSGIDDAVRRLSTTYEVRGMVQQLTSYDSPTVGAGSALNQVVFEYNDYGLPVKDYQAHGGVKDANTPYVATSYDTTASAGRLTKGLRPTSLRYPNGRLLRYEYNSGADDALNRVSLLADDDSGSVGTHLAEYFYLGLGRFVQIDYAEPDLRYDLAQGTGDDPYAGLDRFDRLVDLVWTDYAASSDVVIDEYSYTYDRAGSRTSRTNALNGDLSETYEYDDLNRLIAWDLGGVEQKTWSLDPLGNDLSRGTYNTANEETPTQGSSGYDAAGNMTTLQSGATAVYDAWNRLVQVADGETIVERYAYDAKGRRIQVLSDFAGSTPDRVVDDYHNGQQTIESAITVAGTRDGGYQTVWSLQYIDAAILRDTLTTAGTGIVAAERVFYLSDANYNVTGLVKYDSGDQRWETAERYSYTPYGVVTYRNADWTTATSSANANTTLYTGRTLDLLTTLYYYRARYYDAQLERFVSRDPILYKGGSNLYEYVRGMPTSLVDSKGTDGHYETKCVSWGTGFPGQCYEVWVEDTPLTTWRRCAFNHTKKVLEEMMAVGDALAAGNLSARPGYESCCGAASPVAWSVLRPAIKHALTYNFSDIAWTSGSSNNWWFIYGITLNGGLLNPKAPEILIPFWIHESLHDISQYGMGHGSWFAVWTLDDIAGEGHPGDTPFDPLGLASLEPKGGSLANRFLKRLGDKSTCGNGSVLDMINQRVGPHKCGSQP